VPEVTICLGAHLLGNPLYEPQGDTIVGPLGNYCDVAVEIAGIRRKLDADRDRRVQAPMGLEERATGLAWLRIHDDVGVGRQRARLATQCWTTRPLVRWSGARQKLEPGGMSRRFGVPAPAGNLDEESGAIVCSGP
jgi:hypothetical protein